MLKRSGDHFPDAERAWEQQGMQKLSTAPFRAAKKTERKVCKGKGKETRPGSCKNPPRPRACAGAHEVEVEGRGLQRNVSRYRLAGAAADELIDILGGNKGNDRGTWGYYCYHHDIETLLEKAREIASRHRQGELKWPVRAFQRWLIRNYGREAT